MTAIVDVALTTEAFGTVEARVAAAPAWGTLGAGLDLPVALWIASGVPDTGRLAVEAEGALLRSGRFRLEGQAEARANLQVDLLGTRLAADLVGRVAPTLDVGQARLAARVGWEQPIATAVWVSDYTRDAFAGSGSEPRDGILGPEPGRGLLGLGASGQLARGWRVDGAIDWVFAPGELGLGVTEAVVVGQWPVRAELGVQVELR